ncbi:hypothetical protein HPB47_009947 [Ixodes persulcatus]|uniref:Uncharacterized protein n=1 Tax=Ixodes persulcatus TaxID=34615 RepID=A0AC60P0I0_IXOPE|nr:hypothetical protein HPB47_009947 [Ixodes persulcatus]
MRSNHNRCRPPDFYDRAYLGRPPLSRPQHPGHLQSHHHHLQHHPQGHHQQLQHPGSISSSGTSGSSSSVHSGPSGAYRAHAPLVKQGGLGSNSARARRRRMKCLISLGLILPALAGVIGESGNPYVLEVSLYAASNASSTGVFTTYPPEDKA